MKTQVTPIKTSGRTWCMASHARNNDPKLCPSKVMRFHVLSSTRCLDERYIMTREEGLRSMLNLAWGCSIAS